MQNREKKALQDLAALIETKKILKENDYENEKLYLASAYGAGVGSGQEERGQGFTRIYHIFNSLPFEKTENTEIKLWEWAGDTDRIEVLNEKGNHLEHQVLDTGKNIYWSHSYVTLLVNVTVPAFGYSTVIIKEGPKEILSTFHKEKRQQQPDRFILENEFLRVVIDPLNGSVASAIDKETGFEYINSPGGVFKLITEASRKSISEWSSEMSAWVQGRYKQIDVLNDIRAEMWSSYGGLRCSVFWKVQFGNDSVLTAEYRLEKNSKTLNVQVSCDWNERGSHEKGVPILLFTMPFAWKSNSYLQDIPFGTLLREGRAIDLPALNFTMNMDGQGHAIQIVSRDTYGWRCDENTIGLTLLRASHEPDPVPEKGLCESEFAICFHSDTGSNTVEDALKLAKTCFQRSIVVSNGFHEGRLPLTSSFMSMEGGNGILISAIKDAERSGIIIRLFEATGKDEEATLCFAFDIENASYVDILERPASGNVTVINTRSIHVLIPANSIRTLKIEFSEPV